MGRNHQMGLGGQTGAGWGSFWSGFKKGMKKVNDPLRSYVIPFAAPVANIAVPSSGTAITAGYNLLGKAGMGRKRRTVRKRRARK